MLHFTLARFRMNPFIKFITEFQGRKGPNFMKNAARRYHALNPQAKRALVKRAAKARCPGLAAYQRFCRAQIPLLKSSTPRRRAKELGRLWRVHKKKNAKASKAIKAAAAKAKKGSVSKARKSLQLKRRSRVRKAKRQSKTRTA